MAIYGKYKNNVLLEQQIHSNIYDLSNIEIESISGFYGDNQRYNAIVKLVNQDYLLRGKSEMIVCKDGKVFIEFCKKRDMGFPYRLPGGSWDENENHMKAAIRETKEEARMLANNVEYVTSYVGFYVKTRMKNISSNRKWNGCYIDLYIGDWAGDYKGNIDDVDKDNIYCFGDWYYPEEIINKLEPPHQLALKQKFNL